MANDKKYRYFDTSFGVCRNDGETTERYDGNGVWIKCKFDPLSAIDPLNFEKYDFGETTEFSDMDELNNCLKMIDEDEK